MILERKPTLQDQGLQEQSRVYLFKPRYERVYLSLVIFSLLFCIANLTTGFGSESLKANWLKFFVYFICFNFLHVILTFVGLLFLPEMRSWLRHQFSPSRFFFFGSVITIICYIAVVRVPNIDSTALRGELVIGIYSLLVSLHNISQTKGLSLLLNRLVRSGLSKDQIKQSEKVESFERITFNGMLASSLSFALLIAIRPTAITSEIAILVSVFTGFLAIAIIANSFRYPEAFRSNKVYFLLGTLIYAFIPIMPLALLMNRALHGCEYVFLADRMASNSKVKWNRYSIALAVAIIVLAAIMRAFDTRFVPESFHLMPIQWIGPLISLTVALEYMHYYLDGIIFRFSDPAVRANIGPLIFPKNS